MPSPKTTVLIDWIAATLKQEYKSYAALIDRMAGVFPIPRDTWVVRSKSMNGYELAIVEPMGIIVLSSGAQGMGTHIILSGSTLNNLAEFGYSRDSVLETITRIGGVVKRIDLAIDAKGTLITPDEIYGALETRNASTKFRNYQIMKGNTGGTTLYLGSMKSEKFWRFYDKGAEQGLKNAFWIRFEVQLTGKLAGRVVEAIKHNGVDAVVKSLLRDAIEYDDSSFQEIVNSESAPIEPSARKVTNTKAWLNTAVARTLARVAHEEPAFIDEFWESVTREIAELKAELDKKVK